MITVFVLISTIFSDFRNFLKYFLLRIVTIVIVVFMFVRVGNIHSDNRYQLKIGNKLVGSQAFLLGGVFIGLQEFSVIFFLLKLKRVLSDNFYHQILNAGVMQTKCWFTEN